MEMMVSLQFHLESEMNLKTGAMSRTETSRLNVKLFLVLTDCDVLSIVCLGFRIMKHSVFFNENAKAEASNQLLLDD